MIFSKTKDATAPAHKPPFEDACHKTRLKACAEHQEATISARDAELLRLQLETARVLEDSAASIEDVQRRAREERRRLSRELGAYIHSTLLERLKAFDDDPKSAGAALCDFWASINARAEFELGGRVGSFHLDAAARAEAGRLDLYNHYMPIGSLVDYNSPAYPSLQLLLEGLAAMDPFLVTEAMRTLRVNVRRTVGMDLVDSDRTKVLLSYVTHDDQLRAFTGELAALRKERKAPVVPPPANLGSVDGYPPTRAEIEEFRAHDDAQARESLQLLKLRRSGGDAA